MTCSWCSPQYPEIETRSLSMHRGYFLVCVGDFISDSWTLQKDFWKKNPNKPKICTREVPIHKYCMIHIILKNCRVNSNVYKIITFPLYRLVCHYQSKQHWYVNHLGRVPVNSMSSTFSIVSWLSTVASSYCIHEVNINSWLPVVQF